MRMQSAFREAVRVLMHLNEGYTRVSIARTDALGLADGGTTWDIPTDAIPLHLRATGSQFLAVMPRFTPENHESPEDMRRMIQQVEFHELTGNGQTTQSYTGGARKQR